MKRSLFLAFALVGCASARDGVVTSVNAAADLGTQTEHVLEQLDRQEQEAVKADPAALAEVRARYHRAWNAYRSFRSAWLASAAGVRAYDASVAAGQSPDLAKVLASVKSLAEAESALSSAAAEIGGAK